MAPEVKLIGVSKTGEANPDGTHGVVQRFSKRGRASDSPNALGNVAAVHADAIILMEAISSPQMRGLGLMTCMVMCLFAILGMGSLLRETVLVLKSSALGWSGIHVLVITALVFLFLIFWALPWIRVCWRLDMFAPDNEPTIFDRKHRKIYRLFVPLDQSHRGWRKFFKPIELQAVEYDWDCVTAEYRVNMVANGQTVTRSHRLFMVVRDHPKDGEKQGRLLDEFTVGNSAALGPNTVPMLWEHIRRFMEEKGPALRHGEPLQVFDRPTSLWQSMGVVGPFGPRFKQWWDDAWPVMLFVLFVFPFSLPFCMFWAVCNRISHLTMRQTVWPADVHARVGPVLPVNAKVSQTQTGTFVLREPVRPARWPLARALVPWLLYTCAVNLGSWTVYQWFNGSPSITQALLAISIAAVGMILHGNDASADHGKETIHDIKEIKNSLIARSKMLFIAYWAIFAGALFFAIFIASTIPAFESIYQSFGTLPALTQALQSYYLALFLLPDIALIPCILISLQKNYKNQEYKRYQFGVLALLVLSGLVIALTLLAMYLPILYLGKVVG